MGATGSRPTYVTILECLQDGTVWLQVHMPTGPLARGPYGHVGEAQQAASALERVARGRWAQHQGAIGPGDGGIGGAGPLAWTAVDRGKESPRHTPHQARDFRFPRILAHFLRNST